jgi:hypothetical protein
VFAKTTLKIARGARQRQIAATVAGLKISENIKLIRSPIKCGFITITCDD